MQQISPGDVITFTEYEQTPVTGRRYVRQRMENMLVAAVIRPGEALTRDRIEQYFGSDLSDREYLILSVSQAERIILQDDDENMYCISIVDDFLSTGMQEIEFGAHVAQDTPEAPSYLQFLSAFGGQDI